MLNKNDIIRLIQADKPHLFSEYFINHIFLFGSYTNNTATNDSDIDLLIDVPREKKRFSDYIKLKKRLELLFSKPIDLVYKDSINPIVAMSIQKELIEIE